MAHTDDLPPGRRELQVALALTGLVLLAELGGGLWSHSLSLLSDAGHVLTDVLALGLSLFALEQSRRPANSRLTFGYHRVGMLAAMANAVAMLVIVGVIGIEAMTRLLHPVVVDARVVIPAALAALVVNSYLGLSLAGHRGDINLRAALLHIAGDVASSAAVAVGGVVTLLTRWPYADPILSLAIALLLTWGALRLARDSVGVLLEGTPPGLRLDDVEAAILEVNGIHSVHDLHIWCLAPDRVALTCHVVVDGELAARDAEVVVRDLEATVCHHFGIGHTTIQTDADHPCQSELESSGATHNLQGERWSGWLHRHAHDSEAGPNT